MPNIVFTVHALHFVVHTVLAVPKLFLEIINIFCMLQFVYAKINNFFVRFFFYSIKLFSLSNLHHLIQL